MNRTCPTCKSERCGKHAACARASEAQADHYTSGWVLWTVVGMTETLVRRHLSSMNPFLARLAELTQGDTLRRHFAQQVLLELERSMLIRLTPKTVR